MEKSQLTLMMVSSDIKKHLHSNNKLSLLEQALADFIRFRQKKNMTWDHFKDFLVQQCISKKRSPVFKYNWTDEVVVATKLQDQDSAENKINTLNAWLETHCVFERYHHSVIVKTLSQWVPKHIFYHQLLSLRQYPKLTRDEAVDLFDEKFPDETFIQNVYRMIFAELDDVTRLSELKLLDSSPKGIARANDMVDFLINQGQLDATVHSNLFAPLLRTIDVAEIITYEKVVEDFVYRDSKLSVEFLKNLLAFAEDCQQHKKSSITMLDFLCWQNNQFNLNQIMTAMDQVVVKLPYYSIVNYLDPRRDDKSVPAIVKHWNHLSKIMLVMVLPYLSIKEIGHFAITCSAFSALIKNESSNTFIVNQIDLEFPSLQSKTYEKLSERFSPNQLIKLYSRLEHDAYSRYDQSKVSALFKAIAHRDVLRVEALLKNNNVLIYGNVSENLAQLPRFPLVKDIERCSHYPLELACWLDANDIARLLLAAGANAKTNFITLPLILVAINRNNPDLIQLLIEAGVNVNQGLKVYGYHPSITPMEYVCDYECFLNCEKAAIKLVELGATVNADQFEYAVLHNMVDLARLIKPDNYSQLGRLLDKVCIKGFERAFNYLIELSAHQHFPKHDILLSSLDHLPDYDKDLLHERMNIIQTLLKLGINFESTTDLYKIVRKVKSVLNSEEFDSGVKEQLVEKYLQYLNGTGYKNPLENDFPEIFKSQQNFLFK